MVKGGEPVGGRIVRGVPPFPFVRESIEKLIGQADILVVSATPHEALRREWEEHDLAKYALAICGQEYGTKEQSLCAAATCPPDHALMIGDAPGDQQAAAASGALFFPINPGTEEASWRRFYEEGIARFLTARSPARIRRRSWPSSHAACRSVRPGRWRTKDVERNSTSVIKISRRNVRPDGPDGRSDRRGRGFGGGALCAGLAEAGACVVVADLLEEACRRQAQSLEKFGGQAHFVTIDVTERESIENLLAATLEKTGRANILVNCAGVNAGNPFLEATDAEWDRILTINLKGVFQACQVFARHMVAAGGGAIVNIGSVSSHLPVSRVFAYGASKAGVLNLTRNIAHEFGAQGVRANVICPGFFPAEQNRKLLDAERIDNIMRHTPMRRFGQPEELVAALLLLVSPRAGSFITGAAINVDGGFTAAWF